MDCPICKIPLVMSDKQGIEIDYCPTCRGIWLDRGELEKIIERSNQPYPPQQGNYFSEGNRPYDGHDKHHDDHGSHGGYDQYGRKKKKGLLGDLFDF
jgi:Zn-finger nucleic acid-binding protein